MWNDLVKSIELGRRVFPWATGYGRTSDIWPALGYERIVEGGSKHMEKWVGWRQMRHGNSPPWNPPSEDNAAAFWKTDLSRPLLWIPLCPPANKSAGAEVVPAPSLKARHARPLPAAVHHRPRPA